MNSPGWSEAEPGNKEFTEFTFRDSILWIGFYWDRTEGGNIDKSRNDRQGKKEKGLNCSEK